MATGWRWQWRLTGAAVNVAASNLKGREKKAYDAKRIEALGGKAAANRKVPYHIMMGIKKAAAKREERDRAVVRTVY